MTTYNALNEKTGGEEGEDKGETFIDLEGK